MDLYQHLPNLHETSRNLDVKRETMIVGASSMRSLLDGSVVQRDVHAALRVASILLSASTILAIRTMTTIRPPTLVKVFKIPVQIPRNDLRALSRMPGDRNNSATL